MFRPTSVCLSALSKRTKRVKVQVLKDFPIFQLYKGEVAQVKPSFMRNYLHNYNGARYILQESDVDVGLLKGFQARQAELKASKMQSEAAKAQTAKAQTITSQTAKSEIPPETKKSEPKRLKGILEKDVTVKDVKIPGLDI